MAGGTTVTITGANLANATTVMFGTALATIQSSSATQVVVLDPPGVPGPVDVTVTTAGGTSRHHAGRPIHVFGGADGDGHQPDQGPSAGGTVVTITGTGLANATAVKFGTAATRRTSLANRPPRSW